MVISEATQPSHVSSLSFERRAAVTGPDRISRLTMHSATTVVSTNLPAGVAPASSLV